tara:strand:- start:102 stop:332 length:231 start_codon:yes stop_codon:yes gene_type:complete
MNLPNDTLRGDPKPEMPFNQNDLMICVAWAIENKDDPSVIPYLDKLRHYVERWPRSASEQYDSKLVLIDAVDTLIK